MPMFFLDHLRLQEVVSVPAANDAPADPSSTQQHPAAAAAGDDAS